MKLELLELDLNSFLQGLKMIVYILPSGKKWAVKKTDAKKALRLCVSVKDAYEFAHSLVPKVRQIIVFRNDASIARIYSFVDNEGLVSTEIEFFAGCINGEAT